MRNFALLVTSFAAAGLVFSTSPVGAVTRKNPPDLTSRTLGDVSIVALPPCLGTFDAAQDGAKLIVGLYSKHVELLSQKKLSFNDRLLYVSPDLAEKDRALQLGLGSSLALGQKDPGIYIVVVHTRDRLNALTNIARLAVRDYQTANGAGKAAVVKWGGEGNLQTGVFPPEAAAPGTSMVLVTTIEALNKNFGKVSDPFVRGIFYDEAQHLGGQTQRGVIDRILGVEEKVKSEAKNRVFLTGFTALPRNENLELKQWFENQVYYSHLDSAEDFINGKRVDHSLMDSIEQVKAAIRTENFLPFKELTMMSPIDIKSQPVFVMNGGIEEVNSHYDPSIFELLEDRIVDHAKNGGAIVFIGNSRPELYRLNKEFNGWFQKHGIRSDLSVTAHGFDKGDVDARKALREFRAGEVKALFTLRMLRESIELPEASLIVDLTGEHNLRLFLHVLSQSLNPSKPKPTVQVFSLSRYTSSEIEGRLQKLDMRAITPSRNNSGPSQRMVKTVIQGDQVFSGLVDPKLRLPMKSETYAFWENVPPVGLNTVEVTASSVKAEQTANTPEERLVDQLLGVLRKNPKLDLNLDPGLRMTLEKNVNYPNRSIVLSQLLFLEKVGSEIDSGKQEVLTELFRARGANEREFETWEKALRERVSQKENFEVISRVSKIKIIKEAVEFLVLSSEPSYFDPSSKVFAAVRDLVQRASSQPSFVSGLLLLNPDLLKNHVIGLLPPDRRLIAESNLRNRISQNSSLVLDFFKVNKRQPQDTGELWESAMAKFLAEYINHPDFVDSFEYHSYGVRKSFYGRPEKAETLQPGGPFDPFETGVIEEADFGDYSVSMDAATHFAHQFYIGLRDFDWDAMAAAARRGEKVEHPFSRVTLIGPENRVVEFDQVANSRAFLDKCHDLGTHLPQFWAAVQFARRLPRTFEPSEPHTLNDFVELMTTRGVTSEFKPKWWNKIVGLEAVQNVAKTHEFPEKFKRLIVTSLRERFVSSLISKELNGEELKKIAAAVNLEGKFATKYRKYGPNWVHYFSTDSAKFLAEKLNLDEKQKSESAPELNFSENDRALLKGIFSLLRDANR